MPVSDAQKKASVKYLEKLDEVRIRMPKGKKATIQAHAEAQGQSVNAYINAAIDEKMAQEATESPARTTTSKMILDAADGGSDVLGPSEGRRDTDEGGVPNE